MSYPITIYVDSDGHQYGAALTDQRYTPTGVRTVHGRQVVSAGKWYGSQMNYRPFRRAVAEAQAEAKRRTTPIAR